MRSDSRRFRFLEMAAAAIVALAMTASAPARADDANAAKARALVQSAINMSDSDQAVKSLWQATNIDPTLNEAYVYLGLYYNSRSDFSNVVNVYKKMAKYEPKQPTIYLNIGEAYMSFSPPKLGDALTYYRKAYQLDPNSSFAALRIGEILAQQGDRDGAIKFLKQAAADAAKNPNTASQARKALAQMGAM
ncbi:MAG: tetratricopeptide repeat protein [Candidatus Binataceae bacterium]